MKSFKTVAHILTTFLKKFSKETPSVIVESDLNCQQKNRKNDCIVCSNCNILNNNDIIQKTENNDVNNNNKPIDSKQNNEFVNSVLIPSSSLSSSSNNNFNRRTPLMKRMSSDDSQHNPNVININEQQQHQSPILTTGSSVKSNSSNQINSQNLNQPFQYLSINLEPKFLLTIIQERLESHRKEFGNRVKCVPSIRTINCQHHCVALLTSRLFTILCNDNIFQQKLIINDNQRNNFCFNIIVELLNPNNDPVSIFSIYFDLINLILKLSLA